MAPVDICDDCRAFMGWLCSGHVKFEPFLSDRRNHGPKYGYPKNGIAIKESAAVCPICELFLWSHYHVVEEMRNIKMYLELDWQGKIAAVRTHCDMKEENSFATKIYYVWAGETAESLNHENLCALPAIQEHGGPESISLFQSWIDSCDATHTACAESITGMRLDKEESFPCDRVLDVGEQSDDLIHLVKTEGKTGRYCTLSHCWGPVDQRPLCATTENEVQLFNGITRSDLPKTFQQAVDVARGLHIRYLWIDSLCILQDSDSHWRSQSARMGAIYEEAFLRLAASWARHSAEGLFWTGPSRQPQPVQFPYQSDSSDSSKSIYIWAPEDDVDIRSQSLASRAWAFQESRLARRTIYFSQSHVSWACRKTILNERNCQLYNDFRGTSNTWSSWPIIVLEYSQCELTYETDRLIALQGLANEIANRSKDKYHNGIFLGDLPKQLLWRVGFAGGMQGLPELPSWSWARIAGWKHFLYMDFPQAVSNDQAGARFLALHEASGALQFKGVLVQCSVSNRDLDSDEFRFQPPIPESMLVTFDNRLKRFLYDTSGDDYELIGMVQIDEDRSFTALHFSFMLVGDRWDNGDMSRMDTKNPPVVKEGATLSDCDLIKIHRRGKLYYWVLVLEPVQDTEMTFRRVGMGIVWPKASVEKLRAEQEFYLI